MLRLLVLIVSPPNGSSRGSGAIDGWQKDFEATVDSARAFLYAASVMLLVTTKLSIVRRSFPSWRAVSRMGTASHYESA
jgi:hypothetical protein